MLEKGKIEKHEKASGIPKFSFYFGRACMPHKEKLSNNSLRSTPEVWSGKSTTFPTVHIIQHQVHQHHPSPPQIMHLTVHRSSLQTQTSFFLTEPLHHIVFLVSPPFFIPFSNVLGYINPGFRKIN